MEPKFEPSPEAKGFASRGLGVVGRARSISRVVLWTFSLCLVMAPIGAAQADEMRAMHREIDRLRQELDALREEVRQNKLASTVADLAPARPRQATGPTAASTGEASEKEPSVTEVVPLLEAQVAEQAQTKIESNSKLPVRIFGTMVSSTFFNTGEANWIEVPDFVGPPPRPPLPAGSFSSTLRQSRIGAMVDGPRIGPLKASGFFALDFFGGNAKLDSGQLIGVPRLLYAYVRLEGERTAIEVGQDEMILAPRNPTSLAGFAVPDLFRSGNLYARVPQIRLERKFAAGNLGEWQATGGILAPLGGYLGYDYYPPTSRSRYPALQGRLAWHPRAGGASDKTGLELGVSGHYERQHDLSGPETSWAGAFDFDVRDGRLGLGGEGFIGRGLGRFGGALGQSGKSLGGYVEGHLKATRQLEFNAGFGTDQVIGEYDATQALLGKNSGLFANTIYQFTPELAMSFEYRWLATTPEQGAVRRNNHLNLILAYSF